MAVIHVQVCQLTEISLKQSALTVQMQDGSKKTLSPGESYAIPLGHDDWVEDGEPSVGLVVLTADVYAKSSP